VTQSSPSFFAPLSQAVDITYYNSTLPYRDWQGGRTDSGIIANAFGQRFDLPADSGWVDSVSVMIDGIGTDSIAIVLFSDTILQTSAGYFHLMNTLRTGDPLIFGDPVLVTPAMINGPTKVSIPFPHTHVPMYFYVSVWCQVNDDGDFAPFWLRGDLEAPHGMTTENARAAWIGYDPNAPDQASSTTTNLIDGLFTPLQDTTPVFTNFAIHAFVELATKGVKTSASIASDFSVSPNPARGVVQIGLPMNHSSEMLKVYDLLGRVMMEKELRLGDAKTSIDVSSLPNGTYRIISGGKSTSIVVTH